MCRPLTCRPTGVCTLHTPAAPSMLAGDALSDRRTLSRQETSLAGGGTRASKKQKPKDIDSYLAAQPAANRDVLSAIRETVRAAVPAACEAFVYGVPGFKLDGKPLACYAGFKKHCGFYPMSSAVLLAFAEDLAEYETSEATIRFTPEKPLPKLLVKRLVEARMAELQS